MSRSAIEPMLSPDRLAALRSTRDCLIEAARLDAPDAIDAALRSYVLSMRDVEFGPYTIQSLVQVALDTGLPLPRTRSQRAKRAQCVEAWTTRAVDLALTAPSPGRRRCPTRPH